MIQQANGSKGKPGMEIPLRQTQKFIIRGVVNLKNSQGSFRFKRKRNWPYRKPQRIKTYPGRGPGANFFVPRGQGESNPA